MAAEIQWEIAVSPGALSAFSYDGTYIWMVARYASANSRLFRFSPTLKKFIKPDGSVGDYTNAYVDLGSTSVGNQLSPISNGTYFTLAGFTVVPPNSAKLYRCSDLSLVGGYANMYNSMISNGGLPGFYYNGEWYYPGWNSSPGIGCLYALNSGLGWRIAYNGTVASSATWSRIIGTTVLMGYSGPVVERIDAATMTRSWASNLGIGKIAHDAGYDPIRDEVWVSVNDGECIRLRGSDGAILKRDATAGSYAQSLITSGQDCLITQGCGLLVSGDKVWAGGGGASAGFRVTRRSTSPTAIAADLQSYSAKANGHWMNLVNHPCPQLVIDGTVYFAIGGPFGPYSWTTAAVGWIVDAAPTAPVPALTNLSPMSGPKMRLGFNNPVNVGTPTIGSPAGGFGVTGAAQVDASTLDVNMDFPPTHPLGAAEDVTPPTPPEGGGAVVV